MMPIIQNEEGKLLLQASRQSIINALKTKRTLYWILGAGFIVRLLALIYTKKFAIGGDALSYHRMALQLAHGESFPPYFPPGFPYSLALFHSLFGETQLVSRVAMLAWYGLFSVGIYLLTQKLFETQAANLVTILFAFYPAFILQSVEPLSQLPSAACLVMLAYALILFKQQPSFPKALVIAFTLSFSVLIRPSSILITVLLLGLFLKQRRPLLMLCIAFGLAALPVIGWLIKAERMTGRFVFILPASEKAAIG